MGMMDDVDNQLHQPQRQYGYTQQLNHSYNGFDSAAATWASAQHWTAASTPYTSRTAAPTPPSQSDDFNVAEGGLHAHGFDHNHYQDPSQNQGNGHNRMVVYEDTCDSPECHVPECHEPDCVEELVECTDPACLPEEVCHEPDQCHNTGASICAGSLEVDVISAAAAIASMKPPQMPICGPGHYFQPTQDYTHCMDLANGQYVDVNMNHPRHIGACMFTNAYVPSVITTNGRVGMISETSGLCHYINQNSSFCTSHQVYHNINQPSFQNSTLQYAMSLRDLSSRASSSQDPFTFSTEQTPSSASTYSSPHRSSLETPSQTPHSLSHGPADNSPAPICQWQDHPNAPPCGINCHSKASLQTHIQSTHTAPLSKSLGFICRWSGCSRLSLPSAKSGFAQRSKLDRHMQSHTGHKACKCDLCHHEFSTHQTLESHMRTHTGDKPFKCREPDCGYEAAQASQLTMHTRTKHTREKPLVCDEPGCGRRFAESSNLSKHRKIHEPEEECRCGVCGKGFRRRDQLRRHGKIHNRKEGSGERGGAGSVVGDGEQSEVKYSTSAILPPGIASAGSSFSQLPRRVLAGGSANSGTGMASSSASAAPSMLSDPRELEESRQLLSPSPTIGEFNEDEMEGAAAMMAMDQQSAAAPPVGLVQGALDSMD